MPSSFRRLPVPLRALIAAVLCAAAARAETIALPGGAAARTAITRRCPECPRTGVTACGTADVRYGAGFARSALQGRPRRGYLVPFVLNGGEFRSLARRTAARADLIAELARRFAAARLIVLEEGSARVLPAPAAVEVVFPEPLHACVRDASRPWGCCVGACGAECCEKDLGSPSVTLTWRDDVAGEELRLDFRHAVGATTLERRGARGRVVYYCLTDAAARLQ